MVNAVFAPNASSINNACFGLNNLGNVVGVVTDATGTFGFMARGKQAAASKVFERKFVPPGANSSYARAINSGGDVIGTHVDGARRRGFVAFSPNYKEIPFDYPGAAGTVGAGINDKRGVVGSYVDANGSTHGYTGWLGDTGELLGPLPFDIPYSTGSTRLDGISSDGTVVGSYLDGTRLGDARLGEPVRDLPRRHAFISSSNLFDLERQWRLSNRWPLNPADSGAVDAALIGLLVNDLLSRRRKSDVHSPLTGPVLDVISRELQRASGEPASGLSSVVRRQLRKCVVHSLTP